MWKMEKGFTGNDSTSISSSSATVNNNNNNSNGSSGCTSSNRDMYLKQLNRNSLKISKPIRKQTNPLPPTIPIPDPNPQISGQTQQPPVYNINKNDFRDVVQKLTGSPVHYDRPPVATQPRPSSSRLQRIRPPPLAQIVNRPPQFNPIIPPRPQNDVIAAAAAQQQNFSLLPPLPSVHPAAESPVSAYMRFRQSSDSLLPQNGVGQQLGQMSSPVSDYVKSFLNPGYSSPRWNSVAPPPSSPQLPLLPPMQQPNSPFSMPFGCVPSPRSQYGMLSPNMLFPQTGQMGWPQLPLSPTLPVSSPRWKGI